MRAHSFSTYLLLLAGVSLALPAFAQGEPSGLPGRGPVMLSPDLPFEGVPRDDVDQYGGWKGLQGEATGFFHTEKINGRWWLVTPEGNVFFALGVRKVPTNGSAERFRAWGFNCAYTGGEVPPTAQDKFPYMLNLRIIRLARPEIPVPKVPGMPPWLKYYDVFDPNFPASCDAYLAEKLKPYANDPLMVGFWIENEPCFWGWYEAVTNTELGLPMRDAFVEVARAYYADKPGQLQKDWAKYNVQKVEDLATVQGMPARVSGLSDAWQTAVAERTFSVVREATRRADPNHLNLGVRMMSSAPPVPGVLQAMGKHCDVISMNLYSILPDRVMTQIVTITPLIHMLTGKPIMTSEFSYRGGDTRCPNTLGAPPTVPTQVDRGIGYMSYVSTVASLPFFVGASWYTYQDDNPERAWDRYGEDSNFGMVDGQERPYAALVEPMRITNKSIYELAADPQPNPECPIFYRTALTRWDKEWNKLFLRRYARLDKPLPDPLAQQLPEDRRFHERYWVHHESPSLTVNDFRFVGDCKANLIRKREGGHELSLLGLEYCATFPRSLWLGDGCKDPDKALVLEGNGKVLTRDVDSDGTVRLMTVVDGSFVRLNFSDFEFRTNCKVPYLDMRFDHGNKALAVTTRGPVDHLGVRNVKGWKVTWNGKPAKPVNFDAPEDMQVVANPN